MTTPTGDDWDSHWADFASAAEQNPANALRTKAVLERLALGGDGEGACVLDLGCGQGELLGIVAKRWPKARLLGADVSAEGIARAKKRLPQAHFVHGDLTKSVDAKAFPVRASHAICSEVLEHLDSPKALLANARAWLEPGARLVITVPGGPMSAFDKHIGHRGHFTADRVKGVLSDAGYREIRVDRPGFPFFNLYRLTVIARGQKLVDDVGRPQGTLPLAARAAMKGFDVLFKLNADRLNLGWQLVATAQSTSP